MIDGIPKDFKRLVIIDNVYYEIRHVVQVSEETGEVYFDAVPLVEAVKENTEPFIMPF
jgi:hypothetical protein